MAKLTKTFEFTHTLKKTKVGEKGTCSEMLDLNVLAEVSYNGGPVHDENSYELGQIHSIIFDGKNVWQVLYFSELMEEIESSALAEAMDLFTSDERRVAS